MNRQHLSLIAAAAVIVSYGCTPNTGDTEPAEAPADLTSNPMHDQGQYVSFPAVGVKIVRPDGFTDAENFHGFQQLSTLSSVMAGRIPGPFSEVTRGFTSEQMKTRGMTLRSKESVEIDGNTGILLNVTQSAGGIEFVKWILAFGSEKETRIVTATFRKADEAELSDKLKAVVVGTREETSPPPSLGADVAFEISASKKLKQTQSIGKALMYTKDGTILAKSREDPFFIAAPSLSKVPIEDGRQFAVQRLLKTADTKIASVKSNKEVVVDGLKGYEIVADAEDADSGTPLQVYQVILYDDGAYILMQGLVGERSAGEYLPEFKSMAHSLTRKKE